MTTGAFIVFSTLSGASSVPDCRGSRFPRPVRFCSADARRRSDPFVCQGARRPGVLTRLWCAAARWQLDRVAEGRDAELSGVAGRDSVFASDHPFRGVHPARRRHGPTICRCLDQEGGRRGPRAAAVRLARGIRHNVASLLESLAGSRGGHSLLQPAAVRSSARLGEGPCGSAIPSPRRSRIDGSSSRSRRTSR